MSSWTTFWVMGNGCTLKYLCTLNAFNLINTIKFEWTFYFYGKLVTHPVFLFIYLWRWLYWFALFSFYSWFSNWNIYFFLLLFLLFFYYNSIAVILGIIDLNLGFVRKKEQAISLIYKALSIKKFLPRKKIYKYTFEDFWLILNCLDFSSIELFGLWI